MTKDKARKRDVRSRMTKTGEGYTTARHFLRDEDEIEDIAPEVIIRVRDARTPPLEFLIAALPPRIAQPSMGDVAIIKATDRSWDEWFIVLDAWNATNHSHPEIVRYLTERFELTGWWAQTVTVGYERARGMRKVHEHLDGYSVSASRTFGVPVERLYRAFSDEAERVEWLEPGLIKVRTFTENKVWRCEIVEDKSRVEVRFTVKSPEKTSIAIEHAKLPAEEDVAAWRAFWKAHLDRLKEIVT